MILSIELNDNNIKIMEAIKKGENLHVQKCMTINIPKYIGITDVKITDTNFIAGLINEELIKNNIRTKKAVFLINSGTIMIRKITLPLLKKKSEILSMIYIELQQIVSINLSKYKIIYETDDIMYKNDTPYADYIVYCVPEDLVNQYVILAEMLKFKLLKIDILPHVYNAIYKKNLRINDEYLVQSAAFAEINENSISFSVVNNHICNFYISCENYDENFIEYAAETQSIYLSENNYSKTTADKISGKILKFIRNYYAVCGAKEIKKIYIYGNENGLIDIKEAIETNLNIEAEIINNISNITVDERQNEKSFVKQYVKQYVTQYIKQFAKQSAKQSSTHSVKQSAKQPVCVDTKSFFNTILPLFTYNNGLSFINKKNNKTKLYRYAAILIIVAVSVMSYGFINAQVSIQDKQSINTFASESDLDEGNEMSEINEINNETKALKKSIDILENYLRNAESLQNSVKANDYANTEILKNIIMLKPIDTKITSIHMDNLSTQLQCASVSINEITSFLSDLREMKTVQSVYIPFLQSKEKISYSVILKLVDVKTKKLDAESKDLDVEAIVWDVNANGENISAGAGHEFTGYGSHTKQYYEEKQNYLTEEINSLNIPSEIYPEEIIKTLSDISAENNIEIGNIKLSETMPAKNILAEEPQESSEKVAVYMNVTLDFNCNFDNMLLFIDKIKNGKDLIAATDISVLFTEEDKIHASINLVVYALPMNL